MRQVVRVRRVLRLGIVGLIAALVACGGAPTATVVPPAALTPTVRPTLLSTIAPTVQSFRTVTAPPAKPVPGSATAPDASRAVNCGTVEIDDHGTVNGQSARQAEECIWQAYQRCATTGTASLQVERRASPATESFTTRDFTVQGGDAGCTIRETATSQVFAPPPNMPRTITTACAGLARDPSGTLHFQACGEDGNVDIPSPQS